ncbi:hypothetical protein [Microbispora sp. ATCC PTA-5024]|uniref:hypothetical protein n=1 Tax=Microbispora sp. ATCC PTA-5024 TaxID=316330 RepID=UPI0012ECE379|nr:hypothetical protein [Microbispora sp. ATCC PTA-5024]
MRVDLHRDVFKADGFELIITLMRLFVEDRHQWFVNPDDIDDVVAYFLEHAPTKAIVYSDLARKSLVAQSRPAPVFSAPLKVLSESLADHVADLSRPARVVVENRTADGAFIVAIAHVFAAADILRAHTEGWFEFVQSGGSGEIHKVVLAELGTFRKVARVTFLLDSDRGTADQVSKYEKVLSDLQKLGIKGHVLKYREMENYIPNRALAAIPWPKRKQSKLSARITCLKGLTPEQRAFVDIKHGFSREKSNNWPRQIEAAREKMYPAKVRRELSSGFGDGLSELLQQEAATGKIAAADFDSLGPGTCDELRALLALIRDII